MVDLYAALFVPEKAFVHPVGVDMIAVIVPVAVPFATPVASKVNVFASGTDKMRCVAFSAEIDAPEMSIIECNE